MSEGEPVANVVEEAVIVESELPRSTVTTWGAISIGLSIAAILGAVFWASYSVYGYIYCSGLPMACPASWIPYAIVSTTGFVVTLGIGAFLGWAFHRLYGMFRVD